MYIVNILLSAIIIIIGIIIGTQNGNTYVDLNILWLKFDHISLSLIMLEALIFGMLVILIIAGFYEIIQRTKLFKANKKIQELEKELNKVRELVADNVDEQIDKEEDKKEKNNNEEGKK